MGSTSPPSTLFVPTTLVAVATAGLMLATGVTLAGDELPLPTTPEDFIGPGTQPGDLVDPFISSSNCSACHGFYLELDDHEPYDSWVSTMMAQSARDPIWQAAVSIANQDAAGAGELCIRCHAPMGWLEGRSTNGEIADLIESDFDGISCHVCHRMVDPIADVENPIEDDDILYDLDLDGNLPAHAGNGSYIIDPIDARRGPFDDVPINMHGPAQILHSPFHRESLLCGACHDVSIPTLTRQPDGSYVPNDFDTPHPTGDPNDMYPEQRTFSEWKMSQFAAGGVGFSDGRFGGNHPTGVMESCQDCHMPDTDTGGCFAWEEDPFFPRPDMPKHSFAGANTWVLGAVLDEYDEFGSGLSEERVQAANERSIQMLRNASDLDLDQEDDTLNVRVTNWSGHKLPTGYPEGRLMWINVQFFDGTGSLVAERGAYDPVTAEITLDDTKVYRAKHGLDATMAAATGLPEGPSFHLALNNKIFFDNRIPPVGFTNAGFESVGAAPVDYAYADGQHWDDTEYAIPACAVEAVVTVYYQVTTKEYVEFLRDTIEDPADDRGQNAYDRWVARGKSAPVDMDSAVIKLAPSATGDLDGNGVVDVQDLIAVITGWGLCGGCGGDTNCDGVVDVQDLINVITSFG